MTVTPDEPLLTPREAYCAAYHFINQYYGREPIEPFLLMLVSMLPGLDGEPGDPATWPDWTESAEAALADATLPIPEEPPDDDSPARPGRSLRWWLRR